MLSLLKKTVVGEYPSLKGGGAPPFDPFTFDPGNLIEIWDGDVASDPSLGGTTWIGSVGANVLTYGTLGGGNIVVYFPAGINGHGYLQFQESGVAGSYAIGATPVRAQPTTQYLVLGSNTHIGNRRILDDGVNTLRNSILCINPSPNIRYNSVASGVTPIVASPPLGTFIVLTIVKQAGAGLSSIQVGNIIPETYTQASLQNDSGMALNIATTLAGFTCITSKWAYMIIRQGADSVGTRNQFIAWLSNRFAI